jgi:hypothetical protein
MPAYRGTLYRKTFVIMDKATKTPVPITNWTFEAHVKDQRDDETALLELTTGNGGFTVLDAPNGRFEMKLTAAQTLTLPVAKMVMDVLRTDISPGPVYLFGAAFKVKTPVTIDE